MSFSIRRDYKHICYNSSGLKQQKFVLSLFLSLDVRNQGVSRAVQPVKGWGRGLPAFHASNGSCCPLGCGCITPVPPPPRMRLFCLFYVVSSVIPLAFLIEGLTSLDLGPTLTIQDDLFSGFLAQSYLQCPFSQIN